MSGKNTVVFTSFRNKTKEAKTLHHYSAQIRCGHLPAREVGRLVPRQGKFSSEKDERLNINAMFRIVNREIKIMIVMLPEYQVG